MVGLVGRNGAGKTTLMRAVMGHLPPASRHACASTGEDLQQLPRHARAALGIGYMPEDRGLVPQLTVEENIAAASVGEPHARARRAAAAGLPADAGVTEMRGRKALLLSGGQQKLVALAARSRSARACCCSTSRSKVLRRRWRNGLPT